MPTYGLGDQRSQISRLPEYCERRVSPLFRDYERILDKAVELATPESESPDDLSAHYVVARITDRSESEVAAKRSLLPADLQAIPIEALGYIEADILSWLFASDSYSLLSVVGPRGSGKSTLLHYLFRSLPPLAPSLSAKLTILANLNTEAHEIDELAVVQLLMSTAIAQLSENRSLSSDKQRELSRLAAQHSEALSRVDSYQARHSARRAIEDLVREMIRESDHTQKAVVIVLDNCDHLSPASVSEVLSVARFLGSIDGVACMVSLRPFMMRTQLEREYGIGAFVWPSVQISPPDLRYLLQKHLEDAMRHTDSGGRAIVSNANGAQFEFPSLKALVASLTKFLFSAKVQRIATDGLCAGDTRQALRAVRAFLRSRVVPVEEFLNWHMLRTSWDDESDPHPHAARKAESVFIEGAMLDDWEYYREELPNYHNPVMNMFSIRGRAGQMSYTTLYRILSFLEWKGALVDVDDIREVMTRLGYDLGDVQDGLSKLMSFRLITSPRTESAGNVSGEVKITTSGVYYRQRLCGYPGYLFQVIPDVPLRHDSWIQERNPLLCRLGSLMELIERMTWEEALENQCLQVRWSSRAAEALRYGGVLSRQLLNACEVLVAQIGRGAKSSLHERLTEISGVMRATLEPLVAELESARNRILEGDRGKQLAASTEPDLATHKPLELDLGSDGRAVLSLTPRSTVEGQAEVEVGVRLHRAGSLRGAAVAVLIEFEGDKVDRSEACKVLAFMPHDKLDEQRYVVRHKKRAGRRIAGRIAVAIEGKLVGGARIS